MFDGILRAANCTTVACLRDAPQEVLFKANSFLINEVGDGSTGALGPLTGFTPVVDGKYIEDLPTALLARGSYNRKVKRVVVDFLFNSNASTPATDIAAAREFQEYVRRFVTFERNQEDYRGLDDWPNGPGETSFEIVLGSFEVQKGLLGCQPPLSSLE
ncbi:hypothetical protein RJZ90_004654 [Blastomyces dermatitidis]